MRKLLSICVLMLCLSLPVFAGHTLEGGWCQCGTPGCTCDPGETARVNVNAPKESSQGTPSDLGSETLLILAVLLLVLRYKA